MRSDLHALTELARAAIARPHKGGEDHAYLSASDLVVLSPELFVPLMEHAERLQTALRELNSAVWLAFPEWAIASSETFKATAALAPALAEEANQVGDVD